MAPATRVTDAHATRCSAAKPVELKVLDLFAGAGGLSEGFATAADDPSDPVTFVSVQAVEMDPTAAATYFLNHTEAQVFVGRIQDWLNRGSVPEVDVVVGGPPCQGFSTLGKQDAEDERNELWRQYAQTITLTEPRYFVLENVSVFMKSTQYRQLLASTRSGGILSDYTLKATVLNAADFGAPQARRRTVVIGHRRDLPFPGWPEKTHDGAHVAVETALRGVLRKVTTQALPDLHMSFPASDRLVYGEAGTTEMVHPGAFSSRELHVGRSYAPISIQRFEKIPPRGNRFDLPDHLKADCWLKHTSGAADVMGRLYLDRPSVTIRTEFFKPEKGRYLHPTEHRAITHYEATIFQGFPRHYQWVGSKVAIARQIGNAVPIPLGRAIARQLSEAVRQQQPHPPTEPH